MAHPTAINEPDPFEHAPLPNVEEDWPYVAVPSFDEHAEHAEEVEEVEHPEEHPEAEAPEAPEAHEAE